jgi:hypothetical protein
MDFDSMDFGVYKSGVRIKEGNDLIASRPGVGWEATMELVREREVGIGKPCM